MSIGKDVYLDTRLIQQKLEQLVPPSEAHPSILAPTLEGQAIERLLSLYTIDGGLFSRAVEILPSNLPVMQDPKFVADRADLLGKSADASPLTKEALDASRPAALCEIRFALELLENTLLADGRDWVLNTDSPGLADIEATWLFAWLKLMPGALQPEVVGPERFPKVFALLERFSQTIALRKETLGEPKTASGEDINTLIARSDFIEPEGDVDAIDPWVAARGLAKGDIVRMWPTDYGSNHKDEGRLVSITSAEMVIEVQGAGGSLRIHAPRRGFTIQHAT